MIIKFLSYFIIGIFLLVSCVFLFRAIPESYEHGISFTINGVHTQGIVIDNTKGKRYMKGGWYRTVYYPVIKYQDKQGQKYSFTSNIWSSDPYELGSVRSVIYLVDQPNRAIENRDTEIWGAFLMIIIFSIWIAYSFFSALWGRNN